MPGGSSRCLLARATRTVEAVGRSRRDPDAAWFLLRAWGLNVALPDGFDEGQARMRYEVCLRAVEGDPRASALKDALDAPFRRHQEEIARLWARFDRGAEAVTEKTAEAERYRKLTDEALRKARETEEL